MAKNLLTWTIQQLDADGNTLSRRVATLTDVNPSVGDFRGLGLLPDTNAHVQTLPIAQTRQVAIRNTHATAKITVIWTPNGGASATIIVLGPGDGIAFWHQGTGATFGISAVSLTSDTSNATYEMFLGG